MATTSCPSSFKVSGSPTGSNSPPPRRPRKLKPPPNPSGHHQNSAIAQSLFNEVCDTEHVPNLLQVPGVHSVTRMKGEPARFAIAGAVRELPAPSPIYTAIYEIDDPQVLQSPEWAEAVERGRWPSEVRPHTSNRQHLLFKVQ